MDHGATVTLEEALTQRIDLHTFARPIEIDDRWCTAVRSAHTSIDTMLALVGDSALDGATAGRRIQEVERLQRRLSAVRLQLVAAADRGGVPEDSGYLDTGSWLAGTTKGDRRPSASDADLAEAMGTGCEPNEEDDPNGPSLNDDTPGDPDPPEQDPESTGTTPRPRLSATGAALADGRISAEHAKVIARGLKDLPDWVTPEQLRECEAELLALAINRSPARLRRAARRVLERIVPDETVVDAHEDEVVQSEEERAMDASAFWIKDNSDGHDDRTVHRPVGVRDGAQEDHRRHDRTPAPEQRRQPGGQEQRPASGDGKATEIDWQHRRGLALADLLTRIPTDHLHNKTAATLLVTTRLEDLQQQGARVSSTDVNDGVISAGATRRLACGAGIVPAVLGTDSVPLDLGRQSRLFTEQQRLALATRYTECAAETCDRPFAWTEVHHLRPWERGGRTDVANAIPLCGRHHHMIDSSTWRHAIIHREDATHQIRFHRRT